LTQLADEQLLNLHWDGMGKLSAAAEPGLALSVMAPLRHGEQGLIQVHVDGVIRAYRKRTVGGVSYGWVALPAGAHRITAIYG
jgi:hypothetical protein